MARRAAVLAAAYAVGAIPFSQLAARRRGVDLRRVGTGTVSGTGLFRVAGFGPLVLAGVLDVAKGSVGPLLAQGEPGLAAAAGGAAVTGHNWSVFLGGAGGRGFSTAMGALLPTAPEGSALLLAGLAAGRLAGESAIGCLVAYAALVPVLARSRGRPGALAATAVLAPMLLKRLVGNAAPAERTPVTYLNRLVFDRDTRQP